MDYNNWQLFLIYRSRSKAFGAMARFMLATGCRVEEVRKIRAEQVNLAARTITIPWAEAKQGKRSRQNRVIRYPMKLAKMVERRAKRGGVLFQSKTGNPWTMQAVRCTFRRLKTVYPASFPQGAKATAMRYTFTTRAIMNGVGPVELAKLLGHSDLKMIMRHYQKLGKHEEHMQTSIDQAVGSRSRRRSASS
jgi:integrase